MFPLAFREQEESVARCIRERGLPVYAMPEQGGLIVKEGEILPLGGTVCRR